MTQLGRVVRQKTLKKSVQLSGVGVHTGEKVSLTLKPAPANAGIVFKRVDLFSQDYIPALAQYVGDTQFCTTLVQNGSSISTVEHLLSAAAGMGIDNLVVEVNAPELPIMDGSAFPIVQLMASAGIVAQDLPRRFLKIKEIIQLEDQDKWLKIEPYNGFKIDFEIDFSHPAIPKSIQKLSYTQSYGLEANFENNEDMDENRYISELSRARTFGFLSDFEYLRSKNLCLGGSLDNAIVLDNTKVLNPDGLRYPDELVRHKILDAIGDFYLLGMPVLGAVSAYKSGHTLNNRFVRAILNNQSAWETVTMPLSALAIS